jgi:ankyrin repeat protein
MNKCLAIIAAAILLVANFPIFTMEKITSPPTKSSFESLSNKLKMRIIDYVMTGYNERTMGKDIRALASTNRSFYNFLNTEETTQQIVKNDAFRYSDELHQRLVALNLGTKGSIEWLEKYFSNSENLNEYGNVSLIWAAMCGNTKAATMFLAKRIGPDCVNDKDISKQNETPLLIAAQSGFPRTANLFIKAGANVQWQDKMGRTALHNSAFYLKGNIVLHNPLIALILIRAGAVPNAKDRAKRTPLILAAQCAYGFSEVARTILVHGKRNKEALKESDFMGKTALDHALSSGDLETTTLLLEKGADAENTVGYAKCFCHGEDRDQILEVLAQHGAT